MSYSKTDRSTYLLLDLVQGKITDPDISKIKLACITLSNEDDYAIKDLVRFSKAILSELENAHIYSIKYKDSNVQKTMTRKYFIKLFPQAMDTVTIKWQEFFDPVPNRIFEPTDFYIILESLGVISASNCYISDIHKIKIETIKRFLFPRLFDLFGNEEIMVKKNNYDIMLNEFI